MYELFDYLAVQNVMADKLELTVVGLAKSEIEAENFAVILEEIEGFRRLPIAIGSFEAQAIALAMEGMPLLRPSTHDLFKNTLDVLGAELLEVIISELIDGVFYATLVLTSNGDYIQVDARTSDAIALAVRYGCPIFSRGFIMDEAGVIMEMENEEEVPKRRHRKTALKEYSVSELENLLEKVLANEDYESAAKIRDEITRKTSA